MGGGGQVIEYVRTYGDLSSPVLQAHIHFGRPAISGGIVLFLCTNLTPPAGVPAPPACPNPPPTLIGALTAPNVTPRPPQGIAAAPRGVARTLYAIPPRATR